MHRAEVSGRSEQLPLLTCSVTWKIIKSDPRFFIEHWGLRQSSLAECVLLPEYEHQHRQRRLWGRRRKIRQKRRRKTSEGKQNESL